MTVLDWISLIGSIATVAAVIFAAWQVKLALDSHKSNQDAQRKSLRPYMVAQILPRRSVSDAGRIAVKNYGKTSARNVTVTFDPELPRLTIQEINRNSPPGVEYRIATIELLDKVFGQTFTTIAPEQEIQCQYWNLRKQYDGYLASKVFKSTPERDAMNLQREVEGRAKFEEENAGLSADGFSENTQAVINYEDTEGNKYEESFGLHPASIDGYTFISTKSTTSRCNCDYH